MYLGNCTKLTTVDTEMVLQKTVQSVTLEMWTYSIEHTEQEILAGLTESDCLIERKSHS